MFKAKIINNFLDKDTIEILMSYVKNTNLWHDAGNEFWDKRTLNARLVHEEDNRDVGRILYDLRLSVRDEILSSFNLKEIYPDLFQLIRWFPGQSQGPHSDDMKDVPGAEMHNHREFGSIIYLNNDYSGGHTYYPQHGIEVVPTEGTLVIHPATNDHLHGVTEISENMRYTISSFWTTNKRFYDKWEIND